MSAITFHLLASSQSSSHSGLPFSLCLNYSITPFLDSFCAPAAPGTFGSFAIPRNVELNHPLAYPACSAWLARRSP